MDFKIGDEIEEEKSKQKNKSNNLGLIIAIIIAIICGISVFLISNKIFGKKEVKEKPEVSTPLSLEDENVKIRSIY